MTKAGTFYMIAGVLWLMSGVISLIAGNVSMGMVGVVMAIVFMILGFTNKHTEKVDQEISPQSKHLIEVKEVALDTVFITYMAEGQRIKAIKRCREITGIDLMDATTYVDSQMNKEQGES